MYLFIIKKKKPLQTMLASAAIPPLTNSLGSGITTETGIIREWWICDTSTSSFIYSFYNYN